MVVNNFYDVESLKCLVYSPTFLVYVMHALHNTEQASSVVMFIQWTTLITINKVASLLPLTCTHTTHIH